MKVIAVNYSHIITLSESCIKHYLQLHVQDIYKALFAITCTLHVRDLDRNSTDDMYMALFGIAYT
jgi:cation transport regulator ChaB